MRLCDLIQTLAIVALLALAVAAGWWLAPSYGMPTEAEVAADPRTIVTLLAAPKR
jgi:ferric-dicitrate binding protein FerR (iron transport regulator)